MFGAQTVIAFDEYVFVSGAVMHTTSTWPVPTLVNLDPDLIVRKTYVFTMMTPVAYSIDHLKVIHPKKRLVGLASPRSTTMPYDHLHNT